MKNGKYFIAFIIFLVILATGIFLAGGSGATVDESQLKTSVSSTIVDGEEERVEAVKKVIVFVTGNDPDLTRLFEDAINVELAKSGYTIVSRAKSERLFQEEIAKPKDEQAMGAVGIAKGTEAEGIVAVNLDTLSSQMNTSSRGSIKQNMLNSASLQLIDVKNEQILAIVVAEYPQGSRLSQAAKNMVDSLKAR